MKILFRFFLSHVKLAKNARKTQFYRVLLPISLRKTRQRRGAAYDVIGELRRLSLSKCFPALCHKLIYEIAIFHSINRETCDKMLFVGVSKTLGKLVPINLRGRITVLLLGKQIYKLIRSIKTIRRKRKKYVTRTFGKNPYTHRKIRKATWQTPPKTLITQRLQTDLGRSVGVTKATQLVWLNRFTGSQPSH